MCNDASYFIAGFLKRFYIFCSANVNTFSRAIKFKVFSLKKGEEGAPRP
jgi:hypothetical protein